MPRRSTATLRMLPLTVRTFLPISTHIVVAVYMLNLVSTLPLSGNDVESYTAKKLLRRHRFYANDTLLNTSVPCTDEEKECLRYNRILLPSTGRCYPLGDGPEHCRLAVDRYEFERRGGHVRGYCAPTDVCRPLKSYQVQVAYNGRCMMVRHLIKLCGPGPVNLIQHFFGATECAEVQTITPPEPVYIQQPDKKGRCVFPNLRHDLTSVTNQESRTHFKQCSRDQSVCFALKKVFCSETRTCCDLLQQGPCEQGYRVVLNRTAWEKGNVQAECAPIYPCGSDSRLMAFDRKCYNASTVLRVLCPGAVLLPNAFGEMSCVTRDFYSHMIDLKSSRPETCEMTQRVSFENRNAGTYLVPECGLSKNGKCAFI